MCELYLEAGIRAVEVVRSLLGQILIQVNRLICHGIDEIDHTSACIY